MKRFNFFFPLHEESSPTGHLGRGTHYSVFRVPTWHDESLKPLTRAWLQDFAVVWDEDHDDRVLDVAFSLYMHGLLAPVIFIGERKGSLTLLIDPDTINRWSRTAFQEYSAKIESLCSPGDDSWTVAIYQTDRSKQSIINDDETKVSLYLSNIKMLWDLGIKESI